MRTLQTSVDLDDDGDKVIFRQFGGESSLRTLQSGHTVIRADQFDPDGWQLPEITELCQNNDQGRATNYCQSSLMCTRDPEAWTTIHQQETMTRHLHAVADHGRRQHRTATGLPDLIRPILPRDYLGSRVVNKRTVLFNTMTGMCGRALDATSPGYSTAWNTVDDQTVELPRTLHVVRAVRGILRHPVSGTSDADPHGTIRGHLARIVTTGATRDEEQEEQCCASSGGSVGARCVGIGGSAFSSPWWHGIQRRSCAITQCLRPQGSAPFVHTDMGATRYRASKGAGAAEGRGPGGLSPVDL